MGEYEFDAEISEKVEEILNRYSDSLEGLYQIFKAKGVQGGQIFKSFIKDTFGVDFEENNNKYYEFVILLQNSLVFNHDNLDNVLSLQEAAEMYGIDDSTFRKGIADGRIKENECRKTGRNYIIKKTTAKRFAEEIKRA